MRYPTVSLHVTRAPTIKANNIKPVALQLAMEPKAPLSIRDAVPCCARHTARQLGVEVCSLDKHSVLNTMWCFNMECSNRSKTTPRRSPSLIAPDAPLHYAKSSFEGLYHGSEVFRENKVPKTRRRIPPNRVSTLGLKRGHDDTPDSVAFIWFCVDNLVRS